MGCPQDWQKYVPQQADGNTAQAVVFGDGLKAKRIISVQRGRKGEEWMIYRLQGLVACQCGDSTVNQKQV